MMLEYIQNCKGTDVLDLTIVVPCLNEAENIIPILNDIKGVLSNQLFKSEIIVVDDRSDDATLPLAEEWAKENQHSLPVRVVRRDLARRGYGCGGSIWLILPV